MQPLNWGNLAALCAILAAVVAAIRYMIRAEMTSLKDWIDGRFVRRSECSLQVKDHDGRLERLEAIRTASTPRR
jgi:hypothetical protein